MFFKPDQSNVSDAREAVKKQLLRSLIQQVVDELGSANNAELDTDVAAVLKEDGFKESIDSLRAAVSEGVHRCLYDGLVADVVSQLDLSQESPDKYVEAVLEQADFSSLREIIRTQALSRVGSEVMPAIIDEETTAVESFEVTEDEAGALVDAALEGMDAAALRRQVKGMIDARLRSDIVPTVVDEESAAIASYEATDAEDLVDAALEGMDAAALRRQVKGMIDARLRSDIVPTVVDEESAAVAFYEVTEAEAGALVDAALEGMDAAALRRQVKGMIDARLRSDIVPTVVEEESAAIASYEATDAEDLVDAALEGMDAAALRRQVKGMIDARLRSDIVPTVVDEESAAVASYEAADAEDLVDAVLEGMDAAALRRQVKGMIDARLRSDIVPTVVDEESAAVASYEAADAEDLVDAALEGMDAAALRRQVKGMIDARLRSDIVPTVVDEESAAVASYEAADAEDLVDAALEGMEADALRRQVKGMIDARLRSDIVPTVVDEESAAVASYEATDAEDLVDAALEGMDAAALRRQVKGMIDARLRSDIVPTVVDEESAAVASYEAADAEDLVDAALEGMDPAALRRQVKGMIDARLRSDIVPTVVDEESAAVAFYEVTEAEAGALVDAALEGMDAAALRRQVKGMIDARLRSDIVPTVVEEESAAIASYEATDAEDLVDAALEGMDAAALRRQVKGMIDARLRSDIVPTVVDEESAAVASYEAADAEDLVDAVLEGMDAAALRRQVKGMIDARLRSDIVPTVVDEESAAVSASDLTELHDRIQQEVASADVDDAEARLRDLVRAALQERMQGAMTSEVSQIEAALGDISTAFIQERMRDLTASDDWQLTLADAESAFTSGIVALIEEAVATETAFAQRIDEAIDGRITGNTEFMTRLEQQAKYRLVRVLAQDVMAKLDRNDFVKNDVVTEVTSNEAVINPIVETVSDCVLDHIVSNTLERFDDAEDAAALAMGQIDTEQPKIVQVVKELEKHLTRHVSDTAAARLSDQEDLSRMSEKWLEKDEHVVPSAVGYLLQRISSVIRDRVTLEASQTETIVGNVLPSFTAETDEVRAAIRETRNRLIDRVVNLTLHDMANPDQVAVEATKRVSDENERLRNAVSASVELLTERVSSTAAEHLNDASEIATKAASAVSSDLPEFERAIKATMALLHDQIASEVGLRLKSGDVVAADARMLLAEKPTEVEEAISLLENTILKEVADGAKDLLYDLKGASERARSFLKATKEIDAIEEAVRVQLFKSMAGKIVADLHDVDKTSTEAFWHLDQQHAHVRNAMSELRRQLLFTIAKETMTSLADSEAVASESHHLIPASSGPLTEAASRLRDKLVADVAQEAMELMKDTEAVVTQADAQMGDNEEVLATMRGIVERHLMESLLASALSEIGTKVSGMDDAAERLFFRNAVKEIQNVRETAHSEDGQPATMTASSSNEENVTVGKASWSSLDELSGSKEKEPSAKSWRVNEFRPEDWEAVPGASAEVNRTKVRAFPKGE